MYQYVNRIHNYSIRFIRPNRPEVYRTLLFSNENMGVVILRFIGKLKTFIIAPIIISDI